MSWKRFLHRKRSDSELQDEIDTFLTEETADNEARGLTPDEARRQARLNLATHRRCANRCGCKTLPNGWPVSPAT